MLIACTPSDLLTFFFLISIRRFSRTFSLYLSLSLFLTNYRKIKYCLQSTVVLIYSSTYKTSPILLNRDLRIVDLLVEVLQFQRINWIISPPFQPTDRPKTVFAPGGFSGKLPAVGLIEFSVTIRMSELLGIEFSVTIRMSELIRIVCAWI